MNKKGQIYLLGALIIGFLIFILSVKSNIINLSPSNTEFEDISQNYNLESSRFINMLIKEGETNPSQIEEKFKRFTGIFTQYSKTQNPTFGLIYLLNYENNLYIGNFLDKEITLNDEVWDNVIISGCSEKINAVIKSGIGGISYDFDLSEFTICTKTLSMPLNNNFIFKINEEDVDYEVNIIQGQPQVIVVSRENIFQDRKVFLKNEFIK